VSYDVELRDKIVGIRDERAALKIALNEAIEKLKQSCSHDSIAVLPGYKSVFDTYHSERRICIVCTLEEEGYPKALRNTPVVRCQHSDDFWKLRGFVTLNLVPVPR
jgi:hypothetical protein